MSELDLVAVLVPVMVATLAAVALLADLVPDSGGRRGLGALLVAGLLLILGATAWNPLGPAFGGIYVRDAFTAYVERILLAAGALAALGSVDHVDRTFPTRQGEYYTLLLSSLCGMTLVAGARELVTLVVAFELMGVPLYALAAMHKDRRTGVEGAVKLYLSGAISAALTMYGLSFVVGAAGGTTFAALAAAPLSPTLLLGTMLVIAGMSYKIGAVPFHFWVPDTYQAAPTPFVAFLSVAPKAAGFAALARLLHGGFVGEKESWGPMLLVVAITTLLLGNVLAIPQSNVRRLLGFSGIGHVGLLLLALVVGTPESVGMLLFYLATYVGANMGAFFVAEVVGERRGEALVDWSGLGRRNPGLALAMLLCLLSLGGIPFVAGFWGKSLLFWSLWQAGHVWVVALAATMAVVGLFYYLRVARSIYIEEPKREGALTVAMPTAWAIGLSVAAIVVLGVYPRPFVEAAVEAGATLLGR